jgi:LrgB-like family
MAERGEELGGPHEDIPLSAVHEQSESPTPGESIPPTPGESIAASMVPLLDSNDLASELQAPLRAQDPASITGTGGPPIHEHVPGSTRGMQRQDALPLTRAQEWATSVNARIDVYTYTVILFLVGLPVYLVTNYAMPAQLSLNILAYFLALELPPNWRRFLHPALVASVITISGIYVLAMCRGDDFRDGLLAYQTKTKYQQLFAGKTNLSKPGAGDFLSSVLDVSIVALALPMYQYRKELKRSVRSPPFRPNAIADSLPSSSQSLFQQSP